MNKTKILLEVEQGLYRHNKSGDEYWVYGLSICTTNGHEEERGVLYSKPGKGIASEVFYKEIKEFLSPGRFTLLKPMMPPALLIQPQNNLMDIVQLPKNLNIELEVLKGMDLHKIRMTMTNSGQEPIHMAGMAVVVELNHDAVETHDCNIYSSVGNIYWVIPSYARIPSNVPIYVSWKTNHKAPSASVLGLTYGEVDHGRHHRNDPKDKT